MPRHSVPGGRALWNQSDPGLSLPTPGQRGPVTAPVNFNMQAAARHTIKDRATGPPPFPEVLVLSDRMMEHFQCPDKYITCISKTHHTIREYCQDIAMGTVYLNYKYIVLFVGTLHLGVIDPDTTLADTKWFIQEVSAQNPAALMCISAVVPRPMDYPASRDSSDEFNRALWTAVDDMKKRGHNVCFIPSYNEFLDENQNVIEPITNFVEGLFLSKAGTRFIRAAWLRFLGYFPKKTNGGNNIDE